MKVSVRIGCMVALAAMSLSSPTMAARPPEATPVQLAAAQSHRYPANAKTTFNAVLGTLQTLGYVDIDADRESGTISGSTEAKAKTIYNIFWGFGKKKYTQKASLLIEDTGAGSLVRLNLTVYETKARGIFGTSFTDGKLIRQAEAYNDFFRYLDVEMANRGASATTATAAVGVKPTAPVDLGGGVRLIPAETPSGYCIDAPASYVGTGSQTRPVVSQHKPRCG
jgi:hypothetical protein